ncbi:hypothetical protein HOS33_gp126 [Erwinia phage vB_EamM_Y3]|uniref:Uncharacterized protein n=1 Tax=Erwinia phage vB_EamM_Y3 TaxID=1983553 RepID=A0A2H4IB35_9CAUD|nr:hypothetical protein HOS33_gp126 [Erwinia phage vB_EamM_Y3]ARW58766.1 hypothetical protein Y3_126 [Erwinia phage vB_EamM_Y3]QZE55989.1 hypothetical protein pEaSNUABM52_00131 [Erwinia phage pEp_SNUABM_52]
MAMVNGKIVGSKAKKIKKTLKRDKPVEKASDDTEIKKPKKKKVKAEKPAVSKEKPSKEKKVTRKETSEPVPFRIKTGEHGWLSVELSTDDKGSPVVAFRKWYNTKKDAEIKPARGGFNMPADSAELKILSVQLKNLAREIDAKE